VDLSAALKKHFGYDEFRPLQREIITDALNGRDVFALLPTGGGKSLCFQLPALLRDGVTIVVSPLIALMKDQVDALRTSGIAATFLNSTLAGSESRERLRGLDRNQFRLLYVAPERLMMENFLERALNWNIAQIAIDEAHCISEWGHDFRPEYRELKKMRTHFPDVSIMALTATATERVRDDIIKQLKLHAPRCYVASFNRPNLTYRVVAKSSAYQQVLDFIRAHPNDSGIVYCASRKSTDALAEKLTKDGSKRCLITREWNLGNGRAIRKRSCAMMRASSPRRSRSGWGLTNRTSGSLFIMICRRTSKGTIRKRDARVAMACRASACCSSVWAMW
jgi:ATP-dependent DNA helicase RecQ